MRCVGFDFEFDLAQAIRRERAALREAADGDGGLAGSDDEVGDAILVGLADGIEGPSRVDPCADDRLVAPTVVDRAAQMSGLLDAQVMQVDRVARLDLDSMQPVGHVVSGELAIPYRKPVTTGPYLLDREAPVDPGHGAPSRLPAIAL